jgi:hypothetical protein
MLYIDYKFEMTDAGLTFVDADSILEPDCLLKIDTTPFKVGDCFVLTQTVNGNLFFRKTKQRFNHLFTPMQLELNFEK